jgi:hypothetical protein
VVRRGVLSDVVLVSLIEFMVQIQSEERDFCVWEVKCASLELELCGKRLRLQGWRIVCL